MAETNINYEVMHYCPRCGHHGFISWGGDDLCYVCGTKMKEAPCEYELTQTHWGEVTKEEFDQLEQRLHEEVICHSPEFDIDLYNEKDNIIEQKHRQYREAMARGAAILAGKGNVPACVYCGSTNIRKIGYISRSFSAAIFGLGSKKIGKQFHCNNCGGDF